MDYTTRLENIDDKAEYAIEVEDASSVIRSEFDRITSAAHLDPRPAIHGMQLRVLDTEARWLQLQFDSYFDLPLVDTTDGRQRAIDAFIALADKAFADNNVALARELSSEAHLREALLDVDQSILSPLKKARFLRDSEAAKDFKSETIALRGGPVDTTVVDRHPVGPTFAMPIYDEMTRSLPITKDAIYGRTDEVSAEGHTVYRYRHTTVR